jgi:hypothetical protein
MQDADQQENSGGMVLQRGQIGFIQLANLWPHLA